MISDDSSSETMVNTKAIAGADEFSLNNGLTAGSKLSFASLNAARQQLAALSDQSSVISSLLENDDMGNRT